MLDDFIAKNRERVPLSGRLRLDVPHVLLNDSPTPRDLPAKAIFALSKVAFDEKKNLALVYLVVDCGNRCGHGNFMLLRRQGQRWEVADEYQLWIS